MEGIVCTTHDLESDPVLVLVLVPSPLRPVAGLHLSSGKLVLTSPLASRRRLMDGSWD